MTIMVFRCSLALLFHLVCECCFFVQGYEMVEWSTVIIAYSVSAVALWLWNWSLKKWIVVDMDWPFGG